ncbi:MAG TPA: DUF86 domain-containing protein [Cyclobacteriaceae bacterium]|jgi:uncharacterized protein with HEPN domain|nr:DUF86 domain-containing protein [Cytophagales bacterium]HRE67269.1 DUF86 domain-containing protein [Cyclobacteriaceae bacterium]HRF34143.1 DUF86 domain-containing protein [Cyclobacteriaceae bacterium]
MCIDGIYYHLQGRRDFKWYAESLTVKRAVERELSIIGEAVNRVLKEDKNIGLSRAKEIIAFRNRVIHSYDAVDDNLVWKIIMHDLPVLHREVLALL